jgi:hypothetical protein
MHYRTEEHFGQAYRRLALDNPPAQGEQTMHRIPFRMD